VKPLPALASVIAFALVTAVPLLADAPPSNAPAMATTTARLAAAPTPRTLEMGRGPTIVILHDLGGATQTWMPTVRRLAADHHVVLVDLPGHDTTPLPDPFSLEAVAGSLDQVLAKQKPDSTVLVASGMGGLVALLEMQAHPARARGLVVIDAAAKAPVRMSAEQTKSFFDYIDANYDAFLESTYGQLGRDSLENAAIHAQAAQVAPLTIKSYLRAALAADGWAGLRAMKTPLLFVATDRILAGQDWPTTAKAIGYEDPAAVPVRVLHDTGFLVMKNQPDSLATVLHEFEASLAKK
jgi:pimeloyl-ACP methyl ester carboxylesterase